MLRAVALVAAVTILSPAASARAQEGQGEDAWFARDKALHFGVSAGITMVGYAGASLKTDHRPTRRAAAVLLGLTAGVTKEVWDAFGPGDASWRDLTWDVIGTATGVLVAAGIDWLYQRLSEPSVADAR
jgi:putative lipoprotein